MFYGLMHFLGQRLWSRNWSSLWEQWQSRNRWRSYDGALTFTNQLFDKEFDTNLELRPPT